MKRTLAAVWIALAILALATSPAEGKRCRRPCRPPQPTYGVTVVIDPDVVGWTEAEVRGLLRDNAYQLSLVGPSLTIHVQTSGVTGAAISAGTSGGLWVNFRARIDLTAAPGYAFDYANRDGLAHYALSHEYGHAWTFYHYYLTWQHDWAPYLIERGLLGDPRLDTTYSWSTSELIADDYRLLFGDAVSQGPGYIQPGIPDPRDVPGLRDWFVTTWGGGAG